MQHLQIICIATMQYFSFLFSEFFGTINSLTLLEMIRKWQLQVFADVLRSIGLETLVITEKIEFKRARG